MNPTSNEGMQLPPPIMEQPVVGGNSAEQPASAPEQAPAGGEQAPVSAIQPTIAVPTVPLPTISATDDPASTGGLATRTLGAVGGALDDKDLIEKEWVNKAKQIVALNRDDPYKQAEELTVFRADYMKKHYDKNIKLSK